MKKLLYVFAFVFMSVNGATAASVIGSVNRHQQQIGNKPFKI